MRALGLHAGDLDDSQSHWAVERRKLAAGDHDDVVIVGSSRILFDTDLDVWEEMTGRRPDPARAASAPIRGRSCCGLPTTPTSRAWSSSDVTPDLYFMDRFSYLPQYVEILDFWQDESPSERVGHQVGLVLSAASRFPGRRYSLAPLDRAHRHPGPAGRAATLPRSLETVGALRGPPDTHVAAARSRTTACAITRGWSGGPSTAAGPTPKASTRAIEESTAAVDEDPRARRRGRVRAPAIGGLYYENEQHFAPRAKTWDRLLAETGAFGIHFEDYPEMQGLEVPEWSHLSPNRRRASPAPTSACYVSGT